MTLGLINQKKAQIQNAMIKAMHEKNEKEYVEAMTQLF